MWADSRNESILRELAVKHKTAADMAKAVGITTQLMISGLESNYPDLYEQAVKKCKYTKPELLAALKKHSRIKDVGEAIGVIPDNVKSLITNNYPKYLDKFFKPKTSPALKLELGRASGKVADIAERYNVEEWLVLKSRKEQRESLNNLKFGA